MRKAQIQLGETIFVLMIILLLIVFGLVFFADAEEREFEEQQEFIEELDAIALSKYLTQLSELQCSTLEVRRANCLDKYKLEALITYRENHPEQFTQFYFSELEDAKLYVQEIYPSNTTEWVLYNNTLGERTPRRTSLSLIPVVIYDPLLETMNFAVLHMEKYYR